jgi:hypothetical protein
MPPRLDEIKELSKMPPARLNRVLLMFAVVAMSGVCTMLWYTNRQEVANLDKRLSICEESKLKFYQDALEDFKAKQAKEDRKKEVDDSLTNLKLRQSELELKRLIDQANKILKKQKQ